MVDPRMAHATAVHPKMKTIAAIRLNMVVCVPSLSAATPIYLVQLALSSTFHYKVGRALPSLSEFLVAQPLLRALLPTTETPHVKYLRAERAKDSRMTEKDFASRTELVAWIVNNAYKEHFAVANGLLNYSEELMGNRVGADENSKYAHAMALLIGKAYKSYLA